MIHIPVSVGELIDKLSILEIKKERITDPEKLENVKTEYDLLDKLLVVDVPEYTSLKEINEVIWDIEDRIRKCESEKDFGIRFIELARGVYTNNDIRAKIKKEINLKYDSKLIEEKQYTNF